MINYLLSKRYARKRRRVIRYNLSVYQTQWRSTRCGQAEYSHVCLMVYCCVYEGRPIVCNVYREMSIECIDVCNAFADCRVARSYDEDKERRDDT